MKEVKLKDIPQGGHVFIPEIEDYQNYLPSYDVILCRFESLEDLGEAFLTEVKGDDLIKFVQKTEKVINREGALLVEMVGTLINAQRDDIETFVTYEEICSYIGYFVEDVITDYLKSELNCTIIRRKR